MEKAEVYEILNKAYFSPNAHEKALLAALVPLLEGAKFFVDVGASLGQYTEFANRHLRDADIMSIEADPIRFEELERNCVKWGMSGNNRLRPLHRALADIPGTLTFHTTSSNVSGRLSAPAEGSKPSNAPGPWREVNVAAATLDELCGDRTPDFIKMDIEGAEHLALSGARRVLERRRTLLLIELHHFGGPDGKGTHAVATDFMTRLGYRRIWLHDHWLFVPSMEGHRGLALRMALLRIPSALRRRLFK